MANGSIIQARPIWDTQALVYPQRTYNPGVEREDQFAARVHYPTLVKDSPTIWKANIRLSGNRIGGGFETTFNPRPTSNGNRRVWSFYDIFYNRIHYDPAAMNLGQLLNAQTRDIDVWNAYFETRALLDVAALEAEGLELNYGGVPQIFRPLQEKTFKLSVSVDGPPTINASYIFTWDNQVRNYKVTGERIVVFAFGPNTATDFTERLTYYSTLFTAYSGKEQRMALADNPRISYNFQIQVMDNELQRFEALMWGWQSRVFAVPIWNSFTYTKENVAPGAEVIYVGSTAYREFKPDALAVLVAGPGLFEAVEVKEVYEDRLVLKKPVQHAWTKRVPVLPARSMRMAREITYTGPVANFKEVSLTFTADATELLQDYPWLTFYKGLPVLEFSPDMSGGLQGSYTRNMDQEDAGYSLPIVLDQSGLGTPHQVWNFVFTSFAEAQQFKAMLSQLRGICGEFWASTWSPDITLAQTTQLDGFSFYAEEAYHSTMYVNRKGRKDIVIRLRDGTVFYREILSVTNTSDSVPGTELFVLDQGLPRVITPAMVANISYLTQSRFENEAFEFKWTTQDWATVNAMIKGQTDAI